MIGQPKVRSLLVMLLSLDLIGCMQVKCFRQRAVVDTAFATIGKGRLGVQLSRRRDLDIFP